MEMKEREKLNNRNNKIIQIIMEQIKSNCPDSIDMVAIGGSFCNGDIYEKSDLDLVIIYNDEKAKCLDKCFILGDVAMDVYTHDWTSFEQMSNYQNPYVTKLIDLDIIYVHDENVLKYYESLQVKLKENMNNDSLVFKNIQIHFNNLNDTFNKLKDIQNNISLAYKYLAEIISSSEYIIYMLNKTYVKRGTKRIPEEICNMAVLPNGFVDIYINITNCKTIDEIKEKATNLVICITKFLEPKGIKYMPDTSEKEETIEKKELKPENLIGTYEEIYSNWKNKMYHAITIKSGYLSFVTMNSCQNFYDEMASIFDIPSIGLIEKYNPDDLEANAKYFEECMEKWLELYKKNGIDINYYENLTELENLYQNNNKSKNK